MKEGGDGAEGAYVFFFGLAGIAAPQALALALLDRAHIRIDSLYVHLPVRICAALDVLGLMVMLAFAGLLTWHGWHVFFQSFRLGSRAVTAIATPLEYPQFLWLVGLAYFALVTALLLLRAAHALLTGDVATVQRIAGSRTGQQDLEEELENARRRAELAEGRP